MEAPGQLPSLPSPKSGAGMWDMWTCGTVLWGMKNCTLEIAYILVEKGLPYLPRDCQGRLPVAWVKYDI